MPGKPAESHPNPATPSATELARLAAQAGAAQSLARPTATITGPSSDPPRSVTVPKVNLNLPDTTRMIQASLPRVLTDPYLRPQDESAGVVSEPKTAPRNGLPTSELPGIEVKSPEDLGLLIRKARERRNQSQQSFADLAGVGRRFVSELENGKATLELGKVLKVMRAAGISIFARNPP